MLIDLFADCLPNRKKKRWHYTTFVLETLAKLEHLRRSRQMIIPTSLGTQDDYSLLWLAREMISTSPILFLDEFQLPDRAASKIITNLMTSFFHLGGVLIATSNRMPEELAKAAGMEFTPPPTRLDSLSWKFGLGGSRTAGRSEKMFTKQQGEFAGFLEVLKARCDIWEMESGKDYRRRESELETASLIDEQTVPTDVVEGFEGLQSMASGNIGLGYEQSIVTEVPQEQTDKPGSALPRNYLIRPSSAESISENEAWLHAFKNVQLRAVGFNADSADGILWTIGSMRVYGRNVLVPRQHAGITSWTFAELCFSSLGPADYITLASTYHTLILSDVPVLTTLHKNEARRFITLLDALYEARCKLLISADEGPDDLFFPEIKKSSDAEAPTADQDAIYAETIAEVYQDATAPFRPNISMYDSSSPAPDYTDSRLAGLFSDDQLEDGPPNTLSRARSSSTNILGRGGAGLDTGDGRESSSSLGLSSGVFHAKGPDFSQAGIFTGEDERFAYKRARSRLWEMCGARWWARSEDGWWKPVDHAVRRWERSDVPAPAVNPALPYDAKTGGEGGGRLESMGVARDVDEKADEVLFRHGATSPFRTSAEAPPKFEWTHIWGMVRWGKKAGAWGKGVEGLAERVREREKEKEPEKKG